MELFSIFLLVCGIMCLIFNKPLAVYKTEKYKLFSKMFSKKDPNIKQLKFMYKFNRSIILIVGLLLTIMGIMILFK